jgi:hypothetical protein
MGLKKLDINFMTRNEEAKAAFAADPLVYHGKTPVVNTNICCQHMLTLWYPGKGRVGWGVQTLDSMAELQTRATVC